MTIRVNGEALELSGPVTVAELLERLGIDGRRVAVEHNVAVLKRHAFATTAINEGDEIEIVNFVGGGEGRRFPVLWTLLSRLQAASFHRG